MSSSSLLSQFKSVVGVPASASEQLESSLSNLSASSVHSVHGETIKALVRNVALGYNHALFIISEEAGIGKSTLCLSTLNELNLKLNSDFVYISGYSTPYALFEVLYENRNKKLIVLDDLELALGEGKVASLLKSATWSPTGVRVVGYHSTFKTEANLPAEFVFNAGLIVICNSLPESVQMKALLSRSLHYRIELSFKEKMALLYDFIKLPYKDLSLEQRASVMVFLEEQSPTLIKELSYRTLIKLYGLVASNPTDWEATALRILEFDGDLQAYELASRELTPFAQILKFEELTSLGRRSFYRARRRYLALQSDK